MLAAVSLSTSGVMAGSQGGPGYEVYLREFNAIDSDGDGLVSRDELLRFSGQLHYDIDADRDGYVTAGEIMASDPGIGIETAQRRMAPIDTDMDGRITISESYAVVNALMRFDRDLDGHLSLLEVVLDAGPVIWSHFDASRAQAP